MSCIYKRWGKVLVEVRTEPHSILTTQSIFNTNDKMFSGTISKLSLIAFLLIGQLQAMPTPKAEEVRNPIKVDLERVQFIDDDSLDHRNDRLRISSNAHQNTITEFVFLLVSEFSKFTYFT